MQLEKKKNSSREQPKIAISMKAMTGHNLLSFSQESRQFFQRATWLLGPVIWITAHGDFGVFRDMEIAFHAGIRGDNTYIGGRDVFE